MLFLHFLIYASTFSHTVNKYSLRSNKLGTIVRAGSIVKNKIAKGPVLSPFACVYRMGEMDINKKMNKRNFRV